ncbi:AMP-binding protein [Flavobacterium degerlachei]|jgi:O-succinylbenzoic acid--CoA ligase|uniref:O-succinylbenzoic acid--CoA ligase n=1 Tax=Flavobacterium degerlachei TaxID=229203 RepID=A0A1H2SEI8_9FLAO|nr:AMP-binding protein [Flavobacterium degerlachei]SDW29379.1 O-succinylbenzoic acid--CoA ligase [Flavobacterium degerlachei]
MNTVTYKNVHNLFKLNGVHLDKDELCIAAYYLIKEGDAFEKSIGDFLLDWFDNNPNIDLQSSGTTAEPKIIKTSKQSMVNSALATGDFFELSPGDKVLYCLPTRYIAGKMMLVRSFILGLEIDFVAPSSHPLAKNKTKYDFVAMVPLQAQNSLAGLKNVRKMIVGGAKMSKSLEKTLVKSKAEVYETYGMTETVSHIAAKKVGEEAFTLLPNVTISQNGDNCLIINASKISVEPIITNDLVEIINEKQFVFLGRIDNVVNSGGIKLIPEQIEAKLSAEINSRFFVGGISDSVLGEKLILVIEGEKPASDGVSFEMLDKYEKPKEVFYVSKFMETDNGKIKRKEILLSI